MPELDQRLDSVINQNISEIPESKIRSFANQISDIPDLISLSIGEPGFNTPEHVKKAMEKSIEENHSHYSTHNGIPELRKAISKFLKDKYNLDYDASEIIATDGATEALATVLISMVNPGEEVLVPEPAYPTYEALLSLNGSKTVPIDTGEDEFKLTPAKLEEAVENHPNAKTIVLNYPTNPTGVEYSRDELEALAKVLKQRGLLVITDEIYSEITYGQKHTSLAEFIPKQTIVINGVSKSHAMTGYRLGYIAAPQALFKALNKVHGFLVSSPSNPAQYGALEALQNGPDDTESMKVEYQQRRDLVTSALKKLDFKIIDPAGAFYIFAKIPNQFSESSLDFALELANQAHVGVVPGTAFGDSGEGYIRISYAADLDQLEEAMRRITEFVNEQEGNA